MRASEKDPASDRMVEELIKLPKRLIPLLESCVRGNAVHCAAMIIAVLKSCTQHHSVFSACGHCASRRAGSTTPGQQGSRCCVGCMIVMSCIRLLLNPHRLFVRAAQDLLGVAGHSVLQATAVLELARNVLQYTVLSWAQNSDCRQLGNSTSQQEAKVLLFLRLVKAMLLTEAGATAVVNTRAAEAALVLAAEQYAPQPEQLRQRCCIVWQQSGQLISTPHDRVAVECGAVCFNNDMPMRASQAVTSAAADVVAVAAPCIALWENVRVASPTVAPAVGDKRLAPSATLEQPLKVHVGVGSTCPCRAGTAAYLLSSHIDLRGSPPVKIAQNAPLPVFLQSLIGCNSPASGILVLRAVSGCLALKKRCPAHMGVIHHALYCAATALYQMKAALSLSAEWAAGHAAHGRVSSVASAPHVIAEFLQTLSSWIQSHVESQEFNSEFLQTLLPFHQWLCGLFADVGTCRAEQLLSAPVPTCTTPSSATVVSYMLTCAAVLENLGSEQATMHMLSSQQLLSTVRAAALRQVAMIHTMMTCMQTIHGTLEVCVNLLRHLLQFLSTAARCGREFLPHTAQPGVRLFDACCRHSIYVEAEEHYEEYAVVEDEWQVYVEVMRQLISIENLHHLHAVSVLMFEVHRALASCDEASTGKAHVCEQFETRLALLQRLCDMHATEDMLCKSNDGSTMIVPADCNAQKQHAVDRPPVERQGRCSSGVGSRDSSELDGVFMVESSGDIQLCDVACDSLANNHAWHCREVLCKVLRSGRAGLVMLHAGHLSKLSRKWKPSPLVM